MLKTLIILYVAAIGLIIGSFLNVVIYRLPLIVEAELEGRDSKLSLAFPRSHCPRCKHKITWWQNIPVFSYLFLRGKCVGCDTKISLQYPLVELLSAVLSVFLLWYFRFNWMQVIPALLFTWCLLALAIIDIKHMLLPDSLTLSLLWLGLITNSFNVFTDLTNAVYGAVSGYLVLYLLNAAYKFVRKRDGMGGGDFKLLAALGAWFGWQALPNILLASCILSLVSFLMLAIFRKADMRQPYAFGPFLAIAGWVYIIIQPLLPALL